MRTVDWYFDVISPYAWFGLHELARLPPDVSVRYRPLLFAGLLNHWGQKGPAEIAPKRLWTFRACAWWAQRHGVDFEAPAIHPFNPLPWLRLCLLAGPTRPVVEATFRALWTTGSDPADPAALAALADRLGVDPAGINQPQIKTTLQANGDAAIAAGVFGVPSLVIDGEVFWGADSMDFALAFLANPRLLQSPSMQRARTLPVGVQRRPG